MKPVELEVVDEFVMGLLAPEVLEKVPEGIQIQHTTPSSWY